MLREFNLFDVLGISRREIRHSRVLAWLLNPRGTHGLGDLFLRWFLLEVATIAETQGVGDVMTKEVADWRLEQVSSRAERRNIDVLVLGQGDRFVCAIENKINIGEHSNQLERYRKVVDRQHPSWKHVYVFLTPDGRDPAKDADKAAYVPLTHEAVAVIIERVLESEEAQLNPDVASLLRQYTFTLRRRVMETTSDVESLAYGIYGKHRAAINRINRALENKEKRAASVAKRGFLRRPSKMYQMDCWFTDRTTPISVSSVHHTWMSASRTKRNCWTSRLSMKETLTCICGSSPVNMPRIRGGLS